MGVYTIKANAVYPSPGRGSYTIFGGAASIQAALSDNLDTTYVSLTSTFSGYLYGAALFMRLEDTALPAGARVVSLLPRIRGAQTSSSSRQFYMRLHQNDPVGGGANSTDWGKTTLFSLGSTIGTKVGPAETKTIYGKDFDQVALNKLTLEAYYFKNTDVRFYQFEVNVNYDAKPKVDILTPIGNIGDTNSPAIGWSYTDDLQPQTNFQVQILSGSTVIHDSGTVKSTAGTYQLPIDLANGTYTVKVRATQKWAGTNTALFWSDWDTDTFTVDVQQPVQPSVVATAEPTSARVKVDLVTNLNLLGLDASTQEKLVVGTGWPNPWNPQSNCTIAATAAGMRSGARALAVTLNGALAATGNNTTQTTPYGFIQEAEPGVQYRFSAWFARSLNGGATNRTNRVGLRFWQGIPGVGGSVVTSQITFGSTVVENGSTYVEAVVTATAPALTTHVEMIMEWNAGGAATHLHFVDDIYLRVVVNGITPPVPSAGGMRGGFYDDTANLLPYVDSDFEAATYTWVQTGGSGALSFDATQSRHAVGSLKFIASATTTCFFTCQNLDSFPCEPGEVFTLAGSCRATASTGTPSFKVDWYDQNDVLISTSDVPFGTFVGTQWRDIVANVTAPALASYGRPILRIGTPTNPSTYNFDRLAVLRGANQIWIDGYPDSDGPFLTVEYSEDAGVTWVELVTFTTDLLTDVTTYYDHELANARPRRYRAFNWKTENGITFISDLSTVTADVQHALDRVWLHVVGNELATSHQYKFDGGGRSEDIEMHSTSEHYAGRAFPMVEFGEERSKSIKVSLDISSVAEQTAWYALAQSKSRVMFRDGRGRRLRGRLVGLSLEDQKGHPSTVSFAVEGAGNQPWPPEYGDDVA